MLANELIDLLERRGLLDQEIIEALRDQLQQSGARVTPEAMAKLLVDNNHLTRFQATKLIGELRSGDYPEIDDEVPADSSSLDDPLDLLADETDEEDDIVDATPMSDEPEPVDAEPVDAEPVDAEPVDAEPVDAEPVDAEPVDAEPVDAEPVDAMPFGESSATRRPAVKKPTKQPKHDWGSFHIIGVATAIILLLLFGGGLFFMLRKGDSAAYIGRANELYDAQNFSGAQSAYDDFLDDFGQDDEHSSIARTRRGMSRILQAKDSVTDPTRPLTVLKEVLPTIEDEPAMETERANLAGFLVDAAEQIAQAADKAKETEEKKRLLAALDQQIDLILDAKYVTSSLRQTLATRIQGVQESRARVQRSISRNIRLAETLVAMREALDQDETKPAYEQRTQLLREYPELQNQSDLNELIQEASQIQQTLVKPSDSIPETLSDAKETATLQSIVLANRVGRAIPSMRGKAVYFRVRGSVLAFSAEDGKLLWRRFVGYDANHPPVALGEVPDAGVLLSDGQDLEVQRIAGSEGETQWRSQIGEPFHAPIAVDQAVLMTTSSGRVISLDSKTGEARWVTQIPQELEVSPGLYERPSRMYQPGDHSNLYVLDSRNGKCIESYYVGHRQGTIAVPPAALLGHLFVVENAGSDYALVHVLQFDENGEKLEQAQNPFRLVGNVTTPPIIQSRRLIVLTDRGQIVVLDVEPTAEKQKVTRVAEQVATYETPTSTLMEVGRTEMWVTGSRINRYELQINTGRVVPDWGKHQGDAFIAPPRLIDDTLFHARVLRGTEGVRVSAVDPRTGEPRWKTDVGVPVSMLARAPQGQGIHAITAQAALYQLDSEALSEGTTKSPIENPGGDGVALRFENPLAVDDVSSVLVNQASPRQIAVYDPSRAREKLRLVQLALPPGRPSASALFVGGGIMMPLDSGRVVLMNHQTGSRLGSPFQPPAPPDGKINWYGMVSTPADPDQVILGDDRGKIYRVRAGDQVRVLTEADLEYKLLGPMAAIDRTLFATTAGPASDILLQMDTTSLEETGQQVLDGRVVWGPVAAGDQMLLRTDDGKLRGFDAEATPLWSLDLPVGSPVGEPRLIDGNVLLAGEPGWLVVFDPQSGKLLGQSELGQPLSGPPLPIGGRLLVPGDEGAVYITNVPSEVAPTQ